MYTKMGHGLHFTLTVSSYFFPMGNKRAFQTCEINVFSVQQQKKLVTQSTLNVCLSFPHNDAHRLIAIALHS